MALIETRRWRRDCFQGIIAPAMPRISEEEEGEDICSTVTGVPGIDLSRPMAISSRDCFQKKKTSSAFRRQKNLSCLLTPRGTASLGTRKKR